MPLVVKSFCSKRMKGIMRIKSRERIYTSYLIKLRNGFFAIVAKKLVNGRLNFVVLSYSDGKLGVLMNVEGLEKEYYDEVVSGFVKILDSEGLVVNVKILCQKHSKEILRVIG